MARYINATKLTEHIEAEWRKWGDEYDAYQILGDIEDFPTEDVRENVHGHWIDKSMMPEYFEYECSVCGKGHVIAMTPYCYMCGAKMDEEET